MALLGNYNVFAKHPGRDIGGGATGLGYNRADFNKPSMSRAAFSAFDAKSGVPYGTRPPHSWIIPQKPGALAAINILAGSGTLAGSGAMGLNAVAGLAGIATLSADASKIAALLAALAGSGQVSSADARAILQALAALSGSGTAAADIGALGWIIGGLSGSGSLSSPSYGIGHMEADITPFTTLSPENLAAAVWSAIAADNDDTGTMGEKLNDAGSASNPWTESIEGSYTAAELLRIITAAVAGELSGAATTTITIKGVDGTTDRIVATVTADGDRTAVTLDGA